MTLLSRLFPSEEINGHERCPTYLYRWTLLRIGSWLAVYLHKFVGDDWSRDFHDHPKRFISVGLRGSYQEWTPRTEPDWSGIEFLPAHAWTNVRRHRAPWIRTFPATHVHRITGPTPERPCWTLVIVGRAVRQCGFWHLGEWIPWREYVSGEKADARKACP